MSKLITAIVIHIIAAVFFSGSALAQVQTMEPWELNQALNRFERTAISIEIAEEFIDLPLEQRAAFTDIELPRRAEAAANAGLRELSLRVQEATAELNRDMDYVTKGAALSFTDFDTEFRHTLDERRATLKESFDYAMRRFWNQKPPGLAAAHPRIERLDKWAKGEAIIPRGLPGGPPKLPGSTNPNAHGGLDLLDFTLQMYCSKEIYGVGCDPDTQAEVDLFHNILVGISDSTKCALTYPLCAYSTFQRWSERVDTSTQDDPSRWAPSAGVPGDATDAGVPPSDTTPTTGGGPTIDPKELLNHSGLQNNLSNLQEGFDGELSPGRPGIDNSHHLPSGWQPASSYAIGLGLTNGSSSTHNPGSAGPDSSSSAGNNDSDSDPIQRLINGDSSGDSDSDSADSKDSKGKQGSGEGGSGDSRDDGDDDWGWDVDEDEDNDNDNDNDGGSSTGEGGSEGNPEGGDSGDDSSEDDSEECTLASCGGSDESEDDAAADEAGESAAASAGTNGSGQAGSGGQGGSGGGGSAGSSGDSWLCRNLGLGCGSGKQDSGSCASANTVCATTKVQQHCPIEVCAGVSYIRAPIDAVITSAERVSPCSPIANPGEDGQASCNIDIDANAGAAPPWQGSACGVVAKGDPEGSDCTQAVATNGQSANSGAKPSYDPNPVPDACDEETQQGPDGSCESKDPSDITPQDRNWGLAAGGL